MDGRFLKKKHWVRNALEKVISTWHYVISTTQKRKKLQLHNIKVATTTVWRYVTNKGHADMVSEEFATFTKDDQPANSRDMTPLETIWIIVDETTFKVPAPNYTGLHL